MTVARSRRPLCALLLVLSSAMPAARGQVAAQPPRADGVHAIIAVDTATGPAGAEVNESRMLDLLERMRGMGIRVDVTRVPVDRLTPGNILANIRRLDAASFRDRTLLFYYAGHGGTDPRTGHFLRTPGGDLSRATLLAEIRAKSPRLAVVLTDCCSTRATMNGPAPPVPIPPERRAVENLFLQHRGVVDINASSSVPEQGVYQAAFYHPAMGGLFTFAFTSMFNEIDPLFDTEPDEAVERIRPGSKEEFAHRRRFGSLSPWHKDHDKNGFLEWSEALDHLGGVVMRLFEGFQDGVRSGQVTVQAHPRDVQMLLSQVSQDPQVFGALAARSDEQPAVVGAARVEPARRPRLGIFSENRSDRGGAYIQITGIEPDSPATRVVLWQKGRRATKPLALVAGDTITRANNLRVRSREDLSRILDTIPPGGEINLSGTDARTGKGYEATASLDRYEEGAAGP